MLIVFRGPRCAEPDKKNDPSNEWDKCQQEKPTGSPGIVQPTDGYSEARQKKS
jgi:hypothetical protein